MELFVDDQPVVIAGAAELTVQQVAESVTAELGGTNRLLTGIICDGTEVAGDELDAVLASRVQAYGRIEFQTSDPVALMRETLSAAADVFEESNGQRVQAADLLDEGQTHAALGVLTECFQNWNQVHQSVVQCSRVLGVDLDVEMIGGTSAAVWLSGLAERLSAMRDALQASDFVSVADILRYEFDEMCEPWRALIELLKSRAEAMAGG